MIDYHGNRAEWNLIRSVIVQVIIKFPKTIHTFWINTFGRDNVKKKKKLLYFGNPSSFLFSGEVVVAMVIVINSVIGGFGGLDLA